MLVRASFVSRTPSTSSHSRSYHGRIRQTSSSNSKNINSLPKQWKLPQRSYLHTINIHNSKINLKTITFISKRTLTKDAPSRSYATDRPPHTMLGLPALSPTMEQGNIAKWRKKEGDKIKPGDVIAEIETDKATVDFEATDEGFLAKILLPAGTRDLPVGKAIAVVVENESDIGAFKDFKGEEGAPAAAPAPKKEAQAPPPQQPPKQQPQAPPQQQQQPQESIDLSQVVPGAPPPPSPFKPKSGVLASPLAKATAAYAGIDLQSIGQGSGPGGRVVAEDLAGRQPQAPAFVGGVEGQQYTDIANSQVRRVIAQRLTQSKQTIPHYYLTVDCRVDQLLSLRSHFNDQARGQYKLSVNDFVIKAAALALKKVPEANSTWSDQAIRRYHNVDINVAVNTDKGLFTPFVPNADKIGLVSINATVKELADKAKENKLAPNQMTGGTFTISNLGMFGIKSFAAVINPPQACILAVGTTEKRVIVDESTPTTATSSTPQFTVANFMSVTLSCDHRVVDGATGAKWLQVFKDYIEDPTKMLL